jgi:hypothetical protein
LKSHAIHPAFREQIANAAGTAAKAHGFPGEKGGQQARAALSFSFSFAFLVAARRKISSAIQPAD